MYNNIGLTTPRGSGTNGYVIRNLSFVRNQKERVNYQTEVDLAKFEQTMTKKPNKEILEHERKRQIEVQCTELQDTLEEQGFSPDEIQSQVSVLRAKLMEQGGFNEEKEKNGRPVLTESHQIAQANEEKNAKFKEAFGIKDDYKGGSAFNQELQAIERMKEKEEKEQEREIRRLELSKSNNLKKRKGKKKKSHPSSSTASSSSDSGR